MLVAVPFILPVLALLALLGVMVVLLPLSIIQRYRAGTARRVARGWVASLNVLGISLSAAMFLATAAVITVWIPGAFAYSAWGMAAGCALGLVGLRLTRWEPGAQALHYTPNRWLVLSITLAVALRLGFGLWRAWQAWPTSVHQQSWLAESGLVGSMAAGALVLGYYLTFWLGVARRDRKHRRRFAGMQGPR